MNKQEHLLACLAEEAGEIVKAVGKALRFGLDDGYPGTKRTNEGDIKKEVAQLRAVFMMLIEGDFISISPAEVDINNKIISDKVKAVDKFMDYARSTGALTD